MLIKDVEEILFSINEYEIKTFKEDIPIEEQIGDYFNEKMGSDKTILKVETLGEKGTNLQFLIKYTY